MVFKASSLSYTFQMAHPLMILAAIGTGVGVITLAGRPRGASDIVVDSDNIPLGKSLRNFVLSQEQIIQAVRDGHAIYAWRELPQVRGLYVFADALKIGGLRVPVTARTTAAIAKILGATPVTPLLDDMIHNQCDIRVNPPTQDYRIAMSNKAVVAFNRSIDQQVEQATKPAYVPIISSVGKNWVLDNLALSRRGRAVNYGLHMPSARYKSVDGKSRVWQTPGAAHSPDHWDYSQTLRLAQYKGGPVTIDRMPSREELRVTRLFYEPVVAV